MFGSWQQRHVTIWRPSCSYVFVTWGSWPLKHLYKGAIDIEAVAGITWFGHCHVNKATKHGHEPVSNLPGSLSNPDPFEKEKLG